MGFVGVRVRSGPVQLGPGMPLNRTGVGEILAEEGFGRLLRGPEPRASVNPRYRRPALVQRCRIHKERNILDHLPSREHAWVRGALLGPGLAGGVNSDSSLALCWRTRFTIAQRV